VNDWYCECTAPATGSLTGAAVADGDCTIDECTVQCMHCADTGGGNRCENEEQTCDDPDNSTSSTSDWTCTCPEPFHNISAPAGVATCSVDECNDIFEGTIAGTVCTDDDQLCNDAKHTSMNDFVCTCKEPNVGSKTAGAAQCTLDECLVPGNQETCEDQGQMCDDAMIDIAGSWHCVCPAPSTGTELMGAAMCLTDECLIPDNADKCTGASPPQDCEDGDQTTAGNWECKCRGPAVGDAMTQAAECVLDECEATCRTCEKDACGDQQCDDADKQVGSTGGWTCTCIAPEMGQAIAAKSECTLDECAANGHVCESATPAQTCLDTDKLTKGNWECHCTGPSVTFAVARAANCEVDECGEKRDVCEAADPPQTCLDTDKLTQDNWECQCFAAAGHVTVHPMGPVMGCAYVGDCADESNRQVCENAGQLCKDPTDAAGDWQCVCHGGLTGNPVTNGPAQCGIDECTIAENNMECVRQERRCKDDPSDLTVMNNWGCYCPAYQGNAIDTSSGEDTNCVQEQYSTCQTMDIVVLFDGSGSMFKQFGKYEHGFYELVDSLKRWVHHLPLSGAPASDGASSGGQEGKLRVAFMQYGGKAGSDHLKLASVGAKGRLSGSSSELLADLDWHRDNAFAQQTYITEGLTGAADALKESPMDGRRRVVFLISDGALDDSGAAQQEVKNLWAEGNPEVFGVVVRPNATHSAVDHGGEVTLEPLLSEPQNDHLQNVMLEKIASPTGPMSTLCDPTKQFGKYLVPEPATRSPAPSPPTPSPANAGTGDVDDDDEDCSSWIACWWWVLLLLLCSCCFCFVLIAVLVRRRNAEPEQENNNKQYETDKWDDGEANDCEMSGTTGRGGASALTDSLLLNEGTTSEA